ncbi:hypothetical protein L1987_57951 [Smallanthus sonchifolius]|uniref:Uncharacterized protein n=1 Tax=Smallanthus sonchifolius TaxID=185202 RepID=A0ACB9DEA5_9ASTR|nr:hypothetical protein L1987_57951 [Smallanthus sonchifolius]
MFDLCPNTPNSHTNAINPQLVAKHYPSINSLPYVPRKSFPPSTVAVITRAPLPYELNQWVSWNPIQSPDSLVNSPESSSTEPFTRLRLSLLIPSHFTIVFRLRGDPDLAKNISACKLPAPPLDEALGLRERYTDLPPVTVSSLLPLHGRRSDQRSLTAP